VFAVYGITVDPRHLLLIADYMTIDGTYRPLNRSGIYDNTSPLQQMTFETALYFLRSAVLGNKQDDIQSPSSCLITGQPCRVGTGTFDLRLRVH
jgi:DNA-directed RNA polymerase I subunit RPA1